MRTVTQLHIQQSILNMAKTVMESTDLNCLLYPQPGIFSGDPLKYSGWKCAFEALIEQWKIPPAEII